MSRLTDSTRALVAVLSTFVIGIVVGCGLDRTILSPAAHASSVQYGAVPHHDTVLAELRTELKLTDKQFAQVQEIFRARQTEIEAAWAQVHENLKRAMQQTTTDIETVLDSTQVQQLRAWIAKRHSPSSGHAGRKH
ncbi:MAG: hypothetical protein ACRDIC_19155 [bacterium]